jgi:glycerate 2-kinase
MRFDPDVLENDPSRRSIILTVLSAVLDAVDPARAVSQAMHRDGPILTVGDRTIDLRSVNRVAIIALGKASPAMSRAAWDALEGTDRTLLVICDHEEDVPEGAALVIAGHPLPTEQSAHGASAALSLAREAGPDDLVVCLISGGGSALAELPAAGLTLDDVRHTFRLLLTEGVPIEAANTVRHHLSAFKGGRLAEAAAPAPLLTLILSDIAGNPLPSIASGPTVADPSTFADAIDVLNEYGLLDHVPQAVRTHLDQGAAGLVEETPKESPAGQTALVVADIVVAADAALASARATGLEARIATTSLVGEAAPTAVRCLAEAGPGLTVFAGETTVTVHGDGNGGRNQEGALAAAIAVEGRPNVIFATLATDGVDGPTGAAGAIVDGATVLRGRTRGLNAREHLVRNDSNPFLRASRDLLVTGPTGTNVGDVWLVQRDHGHSFEI